MPPLLIPSAAIAFAGTVTAVSNSAAGGPDYIGIAALVSAAAGAVGTLVMSYLAIVRRRQDLPLTPQQITEALREAMDEENKHK